MHLNPQHQQMISWYMYAHTTMITNKHEQTEKESSPYIISTSGDNNPCRALYRPNNRI